MAEIKPSYDTNRTKLSESIPLDAPLGMYIEPTRLCNFKCFYCMHATRGIIDGELEQTGFSVKNMDSALFDKIVKDIMNFPSVPKRIAFSGLGEPLMNKELPAMIKKLRTSGFDGRIDVLTNAALLTPQMSDELIAAGICRLQISIQGLSDADYQDVCSVKVNFDELVSNIKYFYENKKSATVFIKIIDSLVKNKADEKKFFEIFSPICDNIYVEHLVIMQKQMGNHGGKVDLTKNLNNEYVVPRSVCGVMFYFMQVNIDGETFPCSTPGLPNSFSMGNANEKSLTEIWNGKKRNDLIRSNLIHGYKKVKACSDCSSVICITDPAEYLDDCKEAILTRFPKI